MPYEVQRFLYSLGWQAWAAIAAGCLIFSLVLILRSLGLGRRRVRPIAVPVANLNLAFDLAPDKGRADPFARGSAWEQVQQSRSQSSVVAVVMFDSQGKGEPKPGLVTGRSPTGLRLGVDAEVRPGTVLTVKPACAPGGSVALRVEVQNCCPVGKGWELGCRCLGSRSWGTRIYFG